MHAGRVWAAMQGRPNRRSEMADGAGRFVVATVVRGPAPDQRAPGDREVRARGRHDRGLRRRGLRRGGRAPVRAACLPALGAAAAAAHPARRRAGGGERGRRRDHGEPLPVRRWSGDLPRAAPPAAACSPWRGRRRSARRSPSWRPPSGRGAGPVARRSRSRPGTAAVVVAAGGRDEHPVLRAAVGPASPTSGWWPARFAGAAVLDALHLSVEQRARIRTPAGLAIGARTPAESALAILAEITAMRPAPPPMTTVLPGPHPGAAPDR